MNPGRDRVDRDLALRHFERDRLRKTDQAGFGGGVVGLAEVAALADDRTDVDDTPELLLDHRLEDRLGHKKRPRQIYL